MSKTQITDVERFRAIVKNMTDLYEKKNANYGNSFEKLFNELGVISGLVPLHNKLDRATNLVKGGHNDFESLEDTFIDLANYAIMNVIELQKIAEKKTEETTTSTKTKVAAVVDQVKETIKPAKEVKEKKTPKKAVAQTAVNKDIPTVEEQTLKEEVVMNSNTGSATLIVNPAADLNAQLQNAMASATKIDTSSSDRSTTMKSLRTDTSAEYKW